MPQGKVRRRQTEDIASRYCNQPHHTTLTMLHVAQAIVVTTLQQSCTMQRSKRSCLMHKLPNMSTCNECHQSLAGQSYLQALDANWHARCFVCQECRSSLQGVQFFVANGRRVCESCLNRSGDRCRKCNNFITDESTTDRNGDRFHTSCFTCFKCHSVIDGEYYSDMFLMNQPCCQACYKIEAPKLTQRPTSGRWANK